LDVSTASMSTVQRLARVRIHTVCDLNGSLEGPPAVQPSGLYVPRSTRLASRRASKRAKFHRYSRLTGSLYGRERHFSPLGTFRRAGAYTGL
jgi:hypothetical protein